jgi:hypothetical protein
MNNGYNHIPVISYISPYLFSSSINRGKSKNMGAFCMILAAAFLMEPSIQYVNGTI